MADVPKSTNVNSEEYWLAIEPSCPAKKTLFGLYSSIGPPPCLWTGMNLDAARELKSAALKPARPIRMGGR